MARVAFFSISLPWSLRSSASAVPAGLVRYWYAAKTVDVGDVVQHAAEATPEYNTDLRVGGVPLAELRMDLSYECQYFPVENTINLMWSRTGHHFGYLEVNVPTVVFPCKKHNTVNLSHYVNAAMQRILNQ